MKTCFCSNRGDRVLRVAVGTLRRLTAGARGQVECGATGDSRAGFGRSGSRGAGSMAACGSTRCCGQRATGRASRPWPRHGRRSSASSMALMTCAGSTRRSTASRRLTSRNSSMWPQANQQHRGGRSTRGFAGPLTSSRWLIVEDVEQIVVSLGAVRSTRKIHCHLPPSRILWNGLCNAERASRPALEEYERSRALESAIAEERHEHFGRKDGE